MPRHLIKSNIVDQFVPFFAGVTGLESGATVYRMKGNNSATAVGTLVLTADGAVPGWYRIKINEDTIVDNGEETIAAQWLVTHPLLAVPIPIDLTFYDLLGVNTLEINSVQVKGDGTALNLFRGISEP